MPATTILGSFAADAPIDIDEKGEDKVHDERSFTSFLKIKFTSNFIET